MNVYEIKHEITEDDEHAIKDYEMFLSDSKSLFQRKYRTPSECKLTIKDFDLIACIRLGNFSWNMLGKLKKKNTFYSLKIIEKDKVVEMNAINYVMNEKHIVQALNFPFCTKLTFSFKDNSYLYMCMEYIPGGELFTRLRQVQHFEEKVCKFYASQIVLALEYLHYIDLAYRDLKPENILLDAYGYLKLTEFVFCKVSKKQKSYTFCGTPEYLAPEIILSKGYDKCVDWWALGVLIFEMAAGYPPFSSYDAPMKLYEKITKGQYTIPSDFSSDLKMILVNLIEVDFSKRIGNLKNGPDDVKTHPWFREIQWMAVLNKKVTAPYIPKVFDDQDYSNFPQIPTPDLNLKAKTDPYWHHFEEF